MAAFEKTGLSRFTPSRERMGHTAEAGRQGGCGIVDPHALRQDDCPPFNNHRDNLTKSETVTIAAIESGVPLLIAARNIIADFHLMVRRKMESQLMPWIDRARDSLVASFGNGVVKDIQAVRAAIVSSWADQRADHQAQAGKTPNVRTRKARSSSSPADRCDMKVMHQICVRAKFARRNTCELRHADGKLVMFLAIDRVSKFTHVEFHDCAGKAEGAAFLRNVVEVFPYKIHTELTDNGMAFADLPKNRTGASRRFLGPHIFDRVCIAHGIEHRLTKPYHPWTNGQAERMNRTIKDATVKVYHYDDLKGLKVHVLAFVTAYNFANTSRRCDGERPIRQFATPGQRTRQTSKLTRTISFRDRTPSCRPSFGQIPQAVSGRSIEKLRLCLGRPDCCCHRRHLTLAAATIAAKPGSLPS